MTAEEKLQLLHSQNYTVSKSNAIIQKSRYELSLPEQRAICYICSLIKPRTKLDKANQVPFQLEYDFQLIDYARICGIPTDGRFYLDTKELLKGLVKKVMWLTLPDGTETTVNWVSKVWINRRSGKVKVRIDEDMAPYLFDLQEKFTSYGLYNVLKMKSQYSIRLFELLKSYAYQLQKTFEVDELKKLLMVDAVKSYHDYGMFRQKVLEPAIREVNELTELNITMEPETKGRKVIKVKFTISKKTNLEMMRLGI